MSGSMSQEVIGLPLSELVEVLGVDGSRLPSSPFVKAIVTDSRKANPDSVFVAVRGTSVDGHDFLEDVSRRGVVALIVEDRDKVPHSFRGLVLTVSDARQVLSILSSRFYNYPSLGLFTVGVTGTNGKTTTTYMIEAILNALGSPTGVMGTINHHIGPMVWKTELTTPGVLEIQRRLHEFIEYEGLSAVMEVSSHALDQRRVDGVHFDVAIFTNLTRDHLDYHKSMESYFAAKEKLFNDCLAFSSKPKTYAVVNGDDAYGSRIRSDGRALRIMYGSHGDLTYEIISQDFNGYKLKFSTYQDSVAFHLPMIGQFNILNALASVAAGLCYLHSKGYDSQWGRSLETCVTPLERFAGVPGRLQRVENGRGFHIFVDYAHTDDALSNVLTTLFKVREEAQLKSRIITVFGCGGDRDPGKRPLMAQAATRWSDHVIVTSDNPRTEDPAKIIDEIVKGVTVQNELGKIKIEIDRRQAIAKAMSIAKKGDVILVAGKGHEDYQIIGTQKVHFDDVEVIQECLKE